MADTKERILSAALKLFSARGYSSASMRTLARAVGTSQSALYKHFESKEMILREIISRMEQRDMERAKLYHVPELPRSLDEAAYRRATLAELKDYTYAQYLYWSTDEQAADFRRLLARERGASAELNRLYEQYLLGGVIDYLSDIFAGLTDAEPKQCRDIAVRFYAPIYLLLDAEASADAAMQAKRLIEEFALNE